MVREACPWPGSSKQRELLWGLRATGSSGGQLRRALHLIERVSDLRLPAVVQVRSNAGPRKLWQEILVAMLSSLARRWIIRSKNICLRQGNAVGELSVPHRGRGEGRFCFQQGAVDLAPPFRHPAGKIMRGYHSRRDFRTRNGIVIANCPGDRPQESNPKWRNACLMAG